jgi:hypothetical protein
VDLERLRNDRLQRTREQMDAMDLGALVLYAGANIRYVTGPIRATGNTISTSAMWF